MMVSSNPHAASSTAERQRAFRLVRLSFLAFVAAAASACASPPLSPDAVRSELLDTRLYTARGNEPFWRLDITETGMTLTTPERSLTFDGPAVRAPTPTLPGWRGFSGRFGGAVLTAEVRPTVCQDSMSGQTYPDTVTVVFEGAALSGCGGEPLDLLVGSWRLSELTATPGEAAPQTATLDIDATGRISGSTGCNRFFGQLTVTGEGITISGLGTTRMACLTPSLAVQEQRVTQGLAAATAFSIDGEGALVLSSGQGEALRWARVRP